jgi:hypothetical protein
MTRGFAVAIALMGLAGCHDRDPEEAWLDPAAEVVSPAAPGSRYPNLASAQDGMPVMSWLEPAPDGGFALRYSTWTGSSWTGTGTVASGGDWFVNWADFPSVVPVSRSLWAAHWLQQKPGNAYAYDVRIAVSADGGESWSAPIAPHDDGTPTQHGFVSLFGLGESVQAAWLDGRHTTGEHEHASGPAGPMTLRGAEVNPDGRLLGPDFEIDSRVCDCCQTDAAVTREGPVVVYRDRSGDETRDIALVRRTAIGWSDPVHVASDGWKIDACPVNGPAVDARGDTVVVAWFTAPDLPRVRIAFSADGGRSFGSPIEVASGSIAGRVDVLLLPDGRAVVSWLTDVPGAEEIRAQPFTQAGPVGSAVVVARTGVGRSSGFPRMAVAGNGLLIAWTRAGEPPQVRVVYARLR